MGNDQSKNDNSEEEFIKGDELHDFDIENMIKNDAIKKKKGNNAVNDDNFTEVAAPEGLLNRKSL